MTEFPLDAALRAEVVANPADHLPRLIYADYLEEHPDWVPCPRCYGKGQVRAVNEPRKSGAAVGRDDESPCPRCEGKGWASERVERAEFIRCQVRQAAVDETFYISFDNMHYQERSAIPDVKRAAELVHYAWGDELRSYAVQDPLVFNAWEFRAGFPERIQAPLHEWWGPKGHMTKWQAIYPLTQAELTGVRPCEIHSPARWMFCRNRDNSVGKSDPWGLPCGLYDRLEGYAHVLDDNGGWVREAKVFETENLAMDSLIAALHPPPRSEPCIGK